MNELLKLFGLAPQAEVERLTQSLLRAHDKITAQEEHIALLMKDKDALNQLMKDHAAQTVELEECRAALAAAKNHRKKTVVKTPEQV